MRTEAEGRRAHSQLLIPAQSRHQRSSLVTYYVLEIQAQCMAAIISHLETVAVMKW